MKLYAHQQKIIDEDPKKCGLFLGTGGGKTLTALMLAEGNTLVICPKTIRDAYIWEYQYQKIIDKNPDKWRMATNITSLKVISKEDLKKFNITLGQFDTVIVDECHTVFGVTPTTTQKNYVQIPKTSLVFHVLQVYLFAWPPKRLYFCSATPVSKPMHLWALATLLGNNWDWFAFRQKYYFEMQRGVWIPRKSPDLREKMAELTKGFGYTGQLSDWFDVPEQTHKVIHFGLTPEQKKAVNEVKTQEADPLVSRAKIRTIENGVLYGKEIVTISSKEDKLVDKLSIFPSEKIDYIIERADEFPKILIFANYTAQIDEIAKQLTKEGFRVMTLTGKTKDRGSMLSRAEKASNCIVIAQSSISAGYELPSFPCVIYASKSYRYVDYEQSLGRVLRANHLKKNLYIHLVVKGDADEACHETIMKGQDFQEKVMAQEEEDCGY